MIAFPAMKIASDNGVPKAANTAFLGLLSALACWTAGGGGPDALDESFAAKPALVEKNQKVFEAAKAWVASNIK